MYRTAIQLGVPDGMARSFRRDLKTFKPQWCQAKDLLHIGQASGLNRVEIYVTRVQFPFQRFDIRLKYITTGAMLEMLLWKPSAEIHQKCLRNGAISPRNVV